MPAQRRGDLKIIRREQACAWNVSALTGSGRSSGAAWESDSVLSDPMIRRAVWERLRRRLSSRHPAIVLNEFPIQFGVSIADIAVVNGRLEGFEIKSDVDSVRRLKDQVTSYGHVFDRVTIVTTERHRARVENLVPQWWGLMVASGEPVRLQTLRRPKLNRSIEPKVVLNLLLRDELTAIARSVGCRGYGLDTKSELILRIIRTIGPVEAARNVRDRLRERAWWSPRQRMCEGLEIRTKANALVKGR